MCEVLPTIPESSPSPDGENSKLEQLMISMLEERDKLMEKLRESQETYSEATRRLSEVEADNDILMRQLQAFMPEDEKELHELLDDLRRGGLSNGHGSDEEMKKWPIAKKYASMVRELSVAKDKAEEKEEEVIELKSERNNTRLLLEHLECLVARHEKSLRMTVVKKQTAHQAGMSSEVEVLKALKSLFDHHKALDEKVRERLRVAQEKNQYYEDEIKLANHEIKVLQEENKRIKKAQNRNSVLFSKSYDIGGFTREQLALLEDRDQTIDDLQFSLDERAAELEEVTQERDELSGRVQECEEELSMALKELQKERASLKILKMQNNELVSARSELETCVSQAQAELSASQQEVCEVRERLGDTEDQLSSLTTKNTKLEEEGEGLKNELRSRDQALRSAQELNTQQEKIHTEQLLQASRTAEAEEQMDNLKSQLKAAQGMVSVREATVSRLQLSVERMLRERDSTEKNHVAERKIITDDKTKYRELAEGRERDLASTVKEAEQLREELNVLKLHLKLIENKTSPGLSRANKRYSWQPSMDSDPPTPPTSTSTTPHHHNLTSSSSLSGIADRRDKLEKVIEEDEGILGGGGGGMKTVGEMELGDFADENAVAKLMKNLEGHVKKIESQSGSGAGGGGGGRDGKDVRQRAAVADSKQFDTDVPTRVAEGSFFNPGLEAMPRSSSPPRRGRKFKPEALPTSMYRIAKPSPTPPPPPQSSSASLSSTSSSALPPPLSSSSPVPPRNSGGAVSPSNSSSSGSNDSANHSGSSKKSSRRSSLGRLFRRSKKGGSAKGFKRFSEPVPKPSNRVSDPQMRDSVDFGELLENQDDRDEDKQRKTDLLTTVLQRGLHFSHWDTYTLVAWLEVWVGVPYWYIMAIRNCIGNGAMLNTITEAELEQEFGITNSLHRLKLRLAVQEMVSLTSTTHIARTTSLYGEMGHEWIGDYWLPSLGLPQYKEVFKVCLCDARMLEYLTKKDLRTALKMVETSHRNSLQYGISVLKKLDYNREELERRRKAVDITAKKDVIVWTNAHVQEWAESIGLGEHCGFLGDACVHGGLIALDVDFDHEKLSLALKIPLSSFEVRKQVKAEFEILLKEGTDRVSSESQSHGKIVRRLSKKLKVGTRRMTPPSPSSGFIPEQRSSSPVLFASHPLPPHFSPLIEEDTLSSDAQTEALIPAEDTV